MKFATCTLALLLVSSLHAADEPVSILTDEAKLFKPETIAEAKQIIADIGAEFGFDETHPLQVVIETVKSVPGIDGSKFDSLGQREQDRITNRLDDAARKRLETLSLDGLYIRIVAEPLHSSVVASWHTSNGKRIDRGQSRLASYFKRKQMHAILYEGLRRKPDETLLKALRWYQSTLRPPMAVNDKTKEKLLRQNTITKLTELIDEIREEFQFDIVVEVLDTLKEIDTSKLSRMNSAERRAFDQKLTDLATAQAASLPVDGLYIRLVKDPPHVRVIGYPQDRQPETYISSAKLRRLEKTLRNSWRREPDAALRASLEYYQSSLSKPQEPAPLPPYSMVVLVGSLLGFWLLLSFVRRRVAKPNKPLPIYQPAMLGSLFGVPAGYWVNDRLYISERPTLASGGMQLPRAEVPAEPAVEIGAGEPLLDVPIEENPPTEGTI